MPFIGSSDPGKALLAGFLIPRYRNERRAMEFKRN
jgi:hypothetical protein